MRREVFVVAGTVLAIWGVIAPSPAEAAGEGTSAEPRRVAAELPIVPGGLTADQAAARAVKVSPRIELRKRR